jgi:hypothetical protein
VKGELATAIQTDMNTDNTDEATTDATSEDIVTAESTSQPRSWLLFTCFFIRAFTAILTQLCQIIHPFLVYVVQIQCHANCYYMITRA